MGPRPGTRPADVSPLTGECMAYGTLYLVAVPIGNLGDMTPRALETLRAADLIAAEDTRSTQGLLSRFDVRKPMESYHRHNIRQKGDRILEVLRSGRSVALVSDAGTPVISDPGADLVRLCADAGIPVAVVPGPCAAVAGLIGSGLDTARFVFEGFLPVERKERREALARTAGEKRTVILYEAPHRLSRTLADLAAAGLGERRISAGRELTKMHEEFIRTTVDGLAARYADLSPRGEYVLVLEGLAAYTARVQPDGPESGADPGRDASARSFAASLLAQGKPVREVAQTVSRETGMPRRDAYSLALEIRDSGPEAN